MNDLRYALRGFMQTPAFTTAAVVTLALGIGASTAVFSVIDAVLLSPLPYADARRVVRVYNEWEGTPRASLSPAEFFDYLDGTADVFSHFGGWTGGTVNVTGGGEPERVSSAAVTSGVLPALGVEPLLGRVFGADEDGPGASVVVLSHGLWERRFASRQDVVGSSLVVNGQRATVIGVLPRSFRMPDDFGSGAPADIIVPLGLDRARVTARGSHFLHGIARLAPGVAAGRASAAIRANAERFVVAFPDDYPREMRFGVGLVPIRDDVVGDVRPVLLVLLGAVGLVLLIACANVANLMLTRAEVRRREFAVRVALGAGRGRIVAQLLVESVALASIGGTLGVLLAVWGTTGLVALTPQGIPRMHQAGVDPLVLAFAATVTVATGILFGLAPALGWREDSGAVLRESGRGGTATRQRQRLRHGLIVAELALAMVLLAGAGLLLRSFVGLLRVDPGFVAENVLTVRLSLPSASYPEDAQRRAFFALLVDRVARAPGVLAAGAVTGLPLSNPLGDINLNVEGRPAREGEVSPALDWQVITPGYFHAIGMRLVRGRDLEGRDDARAPGAVVINETAARTIFPGEDPIGRRFTLGGGAGPGMVTVVGVVGDIRHLSLGQAPRGEMYIPHQQFMFWNGGAAVGTLTLVLRTAGDPAGFARVVRAQLAALDPELPPGAFVTMEAVAAQSVSDVRFVMLLLVVFAAIALLLATIGIYGVVSYAVSRRTRELGIRMALGARAGQVLGLVLRQGLALIGIGIGIGLAAALVLTRSLAALLYEVPPRDPLTLAAVAATLGSAALLACLAPARSATRVDPMHSLRAE